MFNEIIKREYFVKPGFISIPDEDTLLYTVVGAGVVVTIYDMEKKIGGMSHFIRPKRQKKTDLTTHFALPALIGIIATLENKGSKSQNLEAHIFGGAENKDAKGYIKNLSKLNTEAAIKILEKKNIRISGIDIGSRMGRKIMFNTKTGETVIARVNKIRENDWYPAF